MRTTAWLAVFLVLGCSGPPPAARLHGPVTLTLLHTADTHSQLFPWRTVLGSADARRGLGAVGEVRAVGGFARLATLLRAERARATRVLHLDSGDLFQGSLAFERYGGEPEVLGFDALGVDAQALGNHELDRGVDLVRERYRTLARFPLLAANYRADGTSGLAEVVQPFTVLDAGGLRVGVIGVGNTTSVALLRQRPSELGVLAEDAASAVQGAIDALRPVADVVVALTHLGLDADQELVQHTSGLDLVLGGHQHLTLDAPVWTLDCGGGSDAVVRDAWGRERSCSPRRVPIVHSGAYGKFVGGLELELDDEPARLEAGYDPLDRFEVAALAFELLPVRDDTPEDPDVADLLAPYRDPLLAIPGPELLAYAPSLVERTGATGGDSPLGNLAADAVRAAAEADVAVLGASSLRHDLPPGALDLEGLWHVVPFEDAVVRADLSGAALARAFEHAARSASARDCRTQVHVSGALARLRCPCDGGTCARVFAPATAVRCTGDADCAAMGGACGALPGAAGVCYAPLAAGAVLRVATTRYLAAGGSGLFEPIPDAVLTEESASLAEALAELVREGPACATPADCSSGCGAELVARGRSALVDQGLASAPDAPAECSGALARCRYLPCIDADLGAARDGRIRLEVP